MVFVFVFVNFVLFVHITMLSFPLNSSKMPTWKSQGNFFAERWRLSSSKYNVFVCQNVCLSCDIFLKNKCDQHSAIVHHYICPQSTSTVSWFLIALPGKICCALGTGDTRRKSEITGLSCLPDSNRGNSCCLTAAEVLINQKLTLSHIQCLATLAPLCLYMIQAPIYNTSFTTSLPKY